MFPSKRHFTNVTRTALLLFITCHLLNWEWQGLAGADNELGVETVRVRPCRRGHCSPEWLIGQSVGVFEGECVSVSIKKVCSGTLRRSFLSCCSVVLVLIVFSTIPSHAKLDRRCLSKSHFSFNALV